MDNLSTLAKLFKTWSTDVKPHVYEMFGENQDAYIESWMEYLDQPLARDQITPLQWAFAENYQDAAEFSDSWQDEYSRLLTQLGVTLFDIALLRVDEFGTAFYKYTLERLGVSKTLEGEYFQPSHKAAPDRDGLLEVLLLEYSEFEECQNDYRYYCEKYQLDEIEPESKALFDKSEKLFQDLPDFFEGNSVIATTEVMESLAAIVWKL